MKWFFVALLLLYSGASAWAQGQTRIPFTVYDTFVHPRGDRVAVLTVLWGEKIAPLDYETETLDVYRVVITGLKSRGFERRRIPSAVNEGVDGFGVNDRGVDCFVLMEQMISERKDSKTIVSATHVRCEAPVAKGALIFRRPWFGVFIMPVFDERLSQARASKFPQP